MAIKLEKGMNVKIGCCIVSLVALLGLATWDVSGSPQPPDATSDTLSYVPGDSLCFLHVKGRAFWNSSIFDELKKNVPAAKWKKFEEDVFQETDKITGIARRDFHSATIVIDNWEVPQVPGVALMFASTIPLDRNKYTNNVKTYFAGKFRHFDEGHSSSPPVQYEGIELSPIGALPGQKLYAGLLKPTIAMIGDLETLKKVVKQSRAGAKDGPLNASIKAAQGHDLAFGLQLPETLRNQLLALLQMANGARNIPQMQLGLKVTEALLEMEQMHLILDVQKDLSLNISVKATNEKAATRFQRLFDMWALMGDFGLQYLSDMTDQTSGSRLREFKKLFQTLAEAAAGSKTAIKGTNVDFTMKAANAGPEMLSALTAVFTRIIMMQDRQARQSNLRQLAIAMHNYHNDYNRLPSPGTYKNNRAAPAPGSNEKPLLSWRVQLLPYRGSRSALQAVSF